MAKKRFFAVLACSSAAFLLLAFGVNQGVLAGASGEATEWVHYPERSATSTLDGVREYWVACGQNRYQFESPSSGKVREAAGYDTSGFRADDPRWIKWIDESKQAFYDLSDQSFDCSEINGAGQGYQASPLTLSPGESTRTVLTKDNVSPSYSASVLGVSKAIGNLGEFASFIQSINGKATEGYYVLTSDLASPSSYVEQASRDFAFSGIFDGRGHSISNPAFHGKRMFGYLKGAQIRNLNFSDVSIFSILAQTIEDTLIENCNFSGAKELNPSSGIGFLADYFVQDVALKDVVVDLGESSSKCSWGNFLVPALAGFNQSPDSNPTTYENVVFHGLNSTNMYYADTHGRSLRPDGIRYESTYFVLKNDATPYSIGYLSSSEEAKNAASFFQSKFSSLTGKTLPVQGYASSDVEGYKKPVFYFGDSELASSFGISVPSEMGSYALMSAGKGLYVFASDSMAYQPAVLDLLKEMFGYRYIGDGVEASTYVKGEDVDLPYLRRSFSPSFGYRKCDWSDANDGDVYAFGYNQGMGSYSYYLPAPAVGTLTQETYHTSLRVLYPGQFYSTHPSWYAVGGSGNTFGDDYKQWQLCYTARGDKAEYQAMLQQAASYLKALYANRANHKIQSFLFGTSDNANRCHCSSCEKAIADMGSITGTVVAFVNDLRDLVIPSLPEEEQKTASIGLFAYLAYEDAPLKNGAPSVTMKDNVYALLAPINANYTYPLTDSKNASSMKMFEDWSKAGKISAWLYDTNFMYYLFPFNSFESNYDNLAYLKGKGVSMVYLQGQHNANQPRTGFGTFKKFLAGKAMMDLSQSYSSLKSEFFSSYYGEGGSFMEQFFDSMTANLKRVESNSSYQKTLYPNGQASIYQEIQNSKFWSFDQLKVWRELCDKAMDSATTETAKRHILIESIFPRFATAVLYDWSKWGNLFHKSEAEEALLQFRLSLKEDCKTLGITMVRESGVTMDHYYSAWGIAD